MVVALMSIHSVPLRQMRSFRKVHAAGGMFASLEKAAVEESLLENVHGLLSTGGKLASHDKAVANESLLADVSDFVSMGTKLSKDF